MFSYIVPIKLKVLWSFLPSFPTLFLENDMKKTVVQRKSDCIYTRLLIMRRWTLLAWVTLIGCWLGCCCCRKELWGDTIYFPFIKDAPVYPILKERKHLRFFPTHSCLPASFCSVKSKTHYPNELSPFNKIFLKTWLLYTGNRHWL